MSGLSMPARSRPRAYRYRGLGDAAEDAANALIAEAEDVSYAPASTSTSAPQLKRGLPDAGSSTRPNTTARGTVNAATERKARLEVSAGGGAMSKTQQDFMLALAIGQQKPKGPTGGQVLGWTLAAVAGLGLVALIARPRQ